MASDPDPIEARARAWCPDNWLSPLDYNDGLTYREAVAASVAAFARVEIARELREMAAECEHEARLAHSFAYGSREEAFTTMARRLTARADTLDPPATCAACGLIAPLVDSECPDCRH